MKSVRFGLCIGLVVVASACTAPQTAVPVDVTFASTQSSSVNGYSVTPVRTYVSDGNSRKEVTGVPCTVQGSGFSAKFVTPASVNLPVYGLKSRAVLATCTYVGEAKQLTSSPVNMTEQRAISAGSNGGLLGAIIVAGAVSARKDKESDQFGYGQIVFNFKK